MRTIKKYFNWLFMVVLIAMLASCYPSADLVIEELDIVATLHDEDTDFTIYSTFVMPDTIIQIGDPEDPGFIELPLDNQDEILDQVRTGFFELGYVEELDPENNEPDLVILVEAVAQENFVLYSYGGWWGWWGWYPWYPGWGWGPGWGPGYPGVGVQSYPEGTLIVDMLDAGKISSEDEVIPAVWTGVLNGLLIETNNPDRIPDGIDQMFIQSQYLRIN